jgi:hypothetical protein
MVSLNVELHYSHPLGDLQPVKTLLLSYFCKACGRPKYLMSHPINESVLLGEPQPDHVVHYSIKSNVPGTLVNDIFTSFQEIRNTPEYYAGIPA